MILLLSESPPGQVGTFYGYELHPVQGIAWPMIAVTGGTGAGNEGRGIFGLGYASFRPAEFSGTYYTTSGCQGTAWRAVTQMFTRNLAACGHDLGPEAVRIDARYLSAGDDCLTDGGSETSSTGWPGPPGRGALKVMVMTTSVAVLALVRAYPRCGNWVCCGDADRTDADPVDEPAVYAGVSAEQHLASSCPARRPCS